MPDVGEFLDQVGNYALTWLPLVFFGLIIYLLWRTLQYMPRVKPAKLEASASTLGGTTSPMAWAIRILTTRSNFVGCVTGNVADSAPLMILST